MLIGPLTFLRCESGGSSRAFQVLACKYSPITCPFLLFFLWRRTFFFC
jgi:hypothetical protein